MHYATIYMCNHMNADVQVTDSENNFATQQETTRTHPNQSPDTLISLLILYSIWQFRAFPYIQAARKAAQHQNKNLSSKSALLIPTLSTSAFHSTNLFLFSGHHIPTNSVTPFSDYKPTQPTTPPIALTKGLRSKRQPLHKRRGGKFRCSGMMGKYCHSNGSELIKLLHFRLNTSRLLCKFVKYLNDSA